MNVFLIGSIDIFTVIAKQVFDMGIMVDTNYEQIFAMAKIGEITRLVVWMDAFNYSGNKWNGIRGQGVAENIHKVDPAIPVLIWDGREYDCPDDLPPALQVYGIEKPVRYDNELYLPFVYSREKILEITQNFFQGKLTVQDIPHRECLNMARIHF